MHPIYGRSQRCCACRVAHAEKLQQGRTESYLPKAGFPKTEQFQEVSEIQQYFSNHKLTCLECGHEYRGLQQHINHMHLMSANDYKIKFGIPLSYGLVGCETKELLKVFMTEVNARLTADEIADRVEKMHSLHPHKGGYVSTQPVIKKARSAHVKKLHESPNHISKTISGKTQAPCSECGAMFEVATWSAVTNPCRIKCKKCKAKNRNVFIKEWKKANPDLAKTYGQNYRKRLKAEGRLQEFDKRKWAEKMRRKNLMLEDGK